MKIAFLSFYSGSAQRGVETFVSELSRRLRNHHEVNAYEGRGQDFSKYRLGWRFYLDHQSLEVKKFTQEVLRNLDEDTEVIIPVNGGWQSLLVRLWTWHHHQKMLISGQSGKGWDDRVNLFLRPDVFVALTNYQRDWARRWAFGIRIEKIPNGVDLDSFNPEVRPAEIGLARPIILCVAALEEDKGVGLTIAAVSKLGKGALLLLSSGGSDEARLRTLAGRLLPSRYKILSVPHDKIASYYRAADVMTMTPPYSESFGIVYLEAMACGLPVVASDNPIRREIIGSAGLFVNPNDTDKYARALQEALDKKWGNIPRRQAEKFSWDKIAQGYEKLFKTL